MLEQIHKFFNTKFLTKEFWKFSFNFKFVLSYVTGVFLKAENFKFK